MLSSSCANDAFFRLSGQLEELVRSCPACRHLAYLRARDLRDRLDGHDLWGFEQAPSLSQQGRDRRRAALLDDLLARAQALVALKGPHEPSALLSPAMIQQDRKDVAACRSTLEKIVTQHADRSHAAKARARLRELDATSH